MQYKMIFGIVLALSGILKGAAPLGKDSDTKSSAEITVKVILTRQGDVRSLAWLPEKHSEEMMSDAYNMTTLACKNLVNLLRQGAVQVNDKDYRYFDYKPQNEFNEHQFMATPTGYKHRCLSQDSSFMQELAKKAEQEHLELKAAMEAKQKKEAQEASAHSQSAAHKPAGENESAAGESLAARIAALRLDLTAVIPAGQKAAPSPKLNGSAAAAVPLALPTTPRPMASPPRLNGAHGVSCNCDHCTGVNLRITPDFHQSSDHVWTKPDGDGDSDEDGQPFVLQPSDQATKN